MSFILDALRKSEHSRQQQSGPGLAELPVATARARTNVWAAAAVALLVVNLLAVGILLWRRADRAGNADQAVATSPMPAPVTASQEESVAPVEPTPAANPTLAPDAPDDEAVPPVTAPPMRAGRNPLAEEAGIVSDVQDPELASSAAAVPAGPPAVLPRSAARRGSVVYAEEAMPGGPETSPPPVAASAERPMSAASSLPTADEITARGSLPALHLDLHVYASVPSQRFIFVNSRKYREGDTLQEGPRVESITADGAVLNLRGSRFKLTSN